MKIKRRPETREDRIYRAWAEFHKDNPHVYELVVSLTREARAAGRQRVGMKMVWERARWEFYLKTTDETFKLNNNYTALYAREIMRREADLAGIFETRERKTALGMLHVDN